MTTLFDCPFNFLSLIFQSDWSLIYFWRTICKQVQIKLKHWLDRVNRHLLNSTTRAPSILSSAATWIHKSFLTGFPRFIIPFHQSLFTYFSQIIFKVQDLSNLAHVLYMHAHFVYNISVNPRGSSVKIYIPSRTCTVPSLSLHMSHSLTDSLPGCQPQWPSFWFLKDLVCSCQGIYEDTDHPS